MILSEKEKISSVSTQYKRSLERTWKKINERIYDMIEILSSTNVEEV